MGERVRGGIRMVSKILYSSKSDEWETPQDLFDKLNETYHFDLDVCATEQNAKCDRFFDAAQDGLKKSWGGGDDLVQSSVFQGGRLGTKSRRRTAERNDNGYAGSVKNRHEMVSCVRL